MKSILLGILLLSAGCVVTARGTVRGGMYVTEAPPPPRVESYSPRPGYVWVQGRWVWNRRWVWKAGHWERERHGRTWQQGSWQQQNNQWVWVEGQWVHASAPPVSNPTGPIVRDHRTQTQPQPLPPPVAQPVVSPYPVQAPPPPQAENAGQRAGFIWIAGRWNWSAGQWQWVPGHWERARANAVWTPGRWEMGNQGYYVWIEGSWGAAPRTTQPGVIVRDHR